MKFSRIVVSAISLAIATSASAGSPLPPAPDAVVTMPMADTGTDWSGAYIGGTVGFASGTLTNNAAIGDSLASNTLLGGFAGFNKQRGNLVFGGEVAYIATPINFTNFAGVLENTVDLKARVGYSFGNAMVYGVAGYSFLNLNDVVTNAPLSGVNVGVGVDYKLGSRYFVGAEYLARSLSGAFENNPANFFTNQIVSTVNIRAGISF